MASKNYYEISPPRLDGNHTDDGRVAVSVDECGRLLGISRGTAYAAARSGEIPTIAIRKRRFVSVTTVQRLLNGDLSV